MWSNRALKVGPGGVLSCVTYGICLARFPPCTWSHRVSRHRPYEMPEIGVQHLLSLPPVRVSALGLIAARSELVKVALTMVFEEKLADAVLVHL